MSCWMTLVADVLSSLHRGNDRQGLRALFVFLSLFFVAACERPDQIHRFGGETMGTQWSVQMASLPSEVSPDELEQDIQALLDMINRQMSNYRDDSVITAFNSAAAGEVMRVPPDFAGVLRVTLDIAELTEGAYDPTVGALVDTWGFGPAGRREAAPDDAEVQTARQQVGWRALPFDPATRELTQPGGMALEFGSAAKGYAVDRLAEHLEQRGVRHYLVAIAGDMRLRGHKPDGQPWRIAVERPVAGTRGVHTVLTPGDAAISTSGDYRNFYRDQGREYAHIIDARDGYPVTHNLASVTVLHERAAMADPLATAMFILGPDEAIRFAEDHGLAVLLIMREAEGFSERMTPAFERHIDKESR